MTILLPTPPTAPILGTPGFDVDAGAFLAWMKTLSDTWNGNPPLIVADILGTVSQSAGVPTGSIIQRGSNANGEFIRFADGTQICTRTITVASQISTASGGVFINVNDVTATHSAAFSAVPNASVQMLRPTGTTFDVFASLTAANTTVTTFRFSRINSDATSRDLTANIIVIGRWF